MKRIDIHAARTHLSRVVDEVFRTGEVYLICRNGEPVAELRAVSIFRDSLRPAPSLKVIFREDPVRPVEPDDWPEAFGS